MLRILRRIVQYMCSDVKYIICVVVFITHLFFKGLKNFLGESLNLCHRSCRTSVKFVALKSNLYATQKYKTSSLMRHELLISGV
jgi:hypothetical protein